MQLNLEEIRARFDVALNARVGNGIRAAYENKLIACVNDVPGLVAEVERLRMALEQSQREQFAGSCPAVSPSDQPCIGRAFWHEVHADRIGSTWRDYAGKVRGSGLHVSGATNV